MFLVSQNINPQIFPYFGISGVPEVECFRFPRAQAAGGSAGSEPQETESRMRRDLHPSLQAQQLERGRELQGQEYRERERGKERGGK